MAITHIRRSSLHLFTECIPCSIFRADGSLDTNILQIVFEDYNWVAVHKGNGELHHASVVWYTAIHVEHEKIARLDYLMHIQSEDLLLMRFRIGRRSIEFASQLFV